MADVDKNDIVADLGDVFPGNADFFCFCAPKARARFYGKRKNPSAFQVDAHIAYVPEPSAIRRVYHFFARQFLKGCLFQESHAPVFAKQVDFCAALRYNILYLLSVLRYSICIHIRFSSRKE